MISYINQIINICQLFSRAFITEWKHSFYNIEKRMGTSLFDQIKRIIKSFVKKRLRRFIRVQISRTSQSKSRNGGNKNE